VRLPQIGPFGVKDLFTLVNLGSGVVALHLLFEGEPRHAGYAIILGFLFGDLLDGQVARRTGTSNRFGSELDSVSDHFVHVIVPAILFYAAYRRGGHALLGLAVAGVLIATATIRHALFASERFDFPLAWCGLPRTVSGFVAMAFPLSHVFFAENRARWLTGAVVVVVLSALNLVPIPYMTHRGQRAMQGYAKVAVLLFVLTPAVAFVVDRVYLFDAFFVWTAGYACLGWFGVRPDERKAFYVEHARWRRAVAR
jgi:phosphatidylserine synthase